MSLRLRLVLLTLTLVVIVAVTLSALQLQTLVDVLSKDTISRAQVAGGLTSKFLIDHITQNSAEYTLPGEVVDTRELWTRIVATDPDIPEFLKRTLAQSYFDSLVQLKILNSNGEVLVAYPTEVDAAKTPEAFSEWLGLPWYRRAYDLVTRRPDWEISGWPIGLGAEKVFDIRVLTSSVFVRSEFLPLVTHLAEISLLAIVLGIMLAFLVTHSALRPLHRIERIIDRITQGNFRADEEDSSTAKEFQAVESKLNLLGQRMQLVPQFGSAQKLDVLMERVATQLDVARRLSAISRLSGGVAHEIKNPLNAISLRLDLLKVRLGESDEEVSAELDVLSKEVLRLNRVVTTFLDFSRPVEVHFEDVDLAALAREVADLIRPQAEISNIEVECITPDEPASMSGDQDLLKQAILNLVTNAVEAMNSAGGQLRIEVARSDENWALTVNDTGPGIPPELRDKVFQLYFTSKARGNGIGLAMTYRAAQLHNGTINFASESGVGTTFRLEFPATVTHA
jgi:signal transduction histidine kinase